MRVTKYPQSCLVVEDGGRVLIDPGNLALDAFTLDDFGPLDAVLYTHRHADHLDERHLDAILDRGLTLYGNADVCSLIGEGRAVEVRDSEPVDVAGFEVVPRDLPHVEMVDGSPGPPNTGYLIDRTFFHPGDGAALDIEASTLALPIAGPSISFRTAYRFLEQVGAERAIPIHYDTFVADPHRFRRFCDLAEIVVLADGESTDL